MISCAAVQAAMYSVFVLKRATVCCFLLDQLMAAPARVKRYPVVDFLVPRSPPQSESAYPMRFGSVEKQRWWVARSKLS